MQLTSSYIYLNEVRFHAFHGVMPQEKVVGADFVVDLRVGYDLSQAMQTDNVADTLSYAAVYEVVRREMEQPSDLLERVAARIADAIGVAFAGVTSIDLRLTKVNPPMGAACAGAGVELHLINDKTL
ncbi:MAG: dihydroneopterin aldolase [Prevotella sp.]|nr:dihydroneopterin aldolase [Prevotella sp.]